MCVDRRCQGPAFLLPTYLASLCRLTSPAATARRTLMFHLPQGPSQPIFKPPQARPAALHSSPRPWQRSWPAAAPWRSAARHAWPGGLQQQQRCACRRGQQSAPCRWWRWPSPPRRPSSGAWRAEPGAGQCAQPRIADWVAGRAVHWSAAGQPAVRMPPLGGGLGPDSHREAYGHAAPLNARRGSAPRPTARGAGPPCCGYPAC